MRVATELLPEPRPLKFAACLRHDLVQVPGLYPTVTWTQHLKPPLPLDQQYHPPEQQCVSMSSCGGENTPSRRHIKGSRNPPHKSERNL